MHEVSLCESMIQVVEEQVSSQGYSKVKTIWLEIGELSAVDPDAMLFAFEAVTKNTLAEGARLEIIRIPGSSWCMKCEKKVAVKNRFDECPDCGTYQLQVIAGDEMRIKEMEVD